jgi:hypothetical protein
MKNLNMVNIQLNALKILETRIDYYRTKVKESNIQGDLSALMFFKLQLERQLYTRRAIMKRLFYRAS